MPQLLLFFLRVLGSPIRRVGTKKKCRVNEKTTHSIESMDAKRESSLPRHGNEFLTIVRQAKHAAKHPCREPNEDGKAGIVLHAVHKTLRDRDLLMAGKIMFEDHLPVRVGVRYMFGLLLSMTGWSRKDIKIACITG